MKLGSAKQGDRDWIPPANGAVCGERGVLDGKLAFWCTAEVGHEGDHAAHDGQDTVVARWPKAN